MKASIAQQIVLVTGASRGVGRGVALALASPHRLIYITARTSEPLGAETALPGSLAETAAQVRARGGEAVPVVCDHADDSQVEALFRQIEQQCGRLDLLVNNALAVPEGLTDKGPFWQKSISLIDITDVGMRSSYVASWYAAPLLLKSSQALVVNTSSFGARCYMHGPAYGAGKAAVDKLAHDMAVDFTPYGVTCVSLWLGLTKTERTLSVCEANPDLYGDSLALAESNEFVGRVIEALWSDSARIKKTGQVWIAAELAQAYGVKDLDGKQPPSYRSKLGAPATFNPAVVE